MTGTDARWTAEMAGMTCDACARHVAGAVEAGGGRDADVPWQNGTATFAAADVDEQALADAIRNAGHELRSLLHGVE